MNIKDYLNNEIIKAFQNKGYTTTDAILSQSNRPDLSDYQSNVAMSLAKQEKKSPLSIAQEVQADIELIKGVDTVSIDGPGFINIKLKNKFLEEFNYLTIPYKEPKTVIVDYGGPNIAKKLHVGHLRPATIGESIKRIMRESGDKVIGDVHFGDWGTPMGMLIAQLRVDQPDLNFFKSPYVACDYDIDIEELSAMYIRAAQNFKTDEVFKEQARIITAELQQGNAGYYALWQVFKRHSVAAVKKIYDTLGVEFDLWLGESDVNDVLPVLFEELTRKQIAIEDDAAIIVPMLNKGNKERAPFILRKSDGGYTYGATDVATIKQRVQDYNPDTIIYITDDRQKEHFEQVFEVAKMSGVVSEKTTLEHIWAGTINGADNKPFKTRDGGNVSLQALIDLSIAKAKENIPEDVFEANPIELTKQIEQVAIGALVFQDLKNNRASNYIFDEDNFTKSEGKTGAYIQYAIARINSILEKSEQISEGRLIISHPLERELLLLLGRYSEALTEAYRRREPSVISDYVYTLAQKFSSFYAELSINNEPEERLKKSRIKLVLLTKEALTKGLYLLNIQAPARMVKGKNA